MSRRKEIHDALESLILAGRALSNVAYNLAQKIPSPFEQSSAKAAQERWDEALDKYRQTKARS